MASGGSGGAKRLQKEFQALARRKDYANFYATPEENDIFTWHFIIFGLTDCAYEGGFYHGKLKFPATYPFKAPEIFMITPNGRFHLTGSICMSFSNYHPELWSPAWGVDKIMLGLLSFMQSEELTYGGIRASDEERRRLASESEKFNAANPVFTRNFPDPLVEQLKASLNKAKIARQETQKLKEKQRQEESERAQAVQLGFFKAGMGASQQTKPAIVLTTMLGLRYRAWASQL